MPEAPLPQLPTDASLRLWSVISAIRSRRPPYLPLRVVPATDATGSAVFASLLAEDTHGDALSYVDLLCNMHGAIQDKLMKG